MTSLHQSTAENLVALPDAAKKMTVIEAVRSAMEVELERDDDVVLLGQDIGTDGGVFRATDGLLDRFGPTRVMDTPLAESGIIGFALGMSVLGYRPVAEIQFMGFLYPGINQLLGHVARYRNRTRGEYHAPLVVRMPYGGGIHSPEHHSESYEAMLAAAPGLKVVIPSTPYDAKGLLIAAIRDDDPVVFMEPKKIYRAFREDVPLGDYTVPIGKARVAKEGSDISFISYGAMMRVALDAAGVLESEGVSAEVLDLRTISPVDRDAIVATVTKTGRAVVINEAPREAGFAAEIATLIGEHALLHLLAPVGRVTGFDTVFPYAGLEAHYLPNRQRVIAAARAALEF